VSRMFLSSRLVEARNRWPLALVATRHVDALDVAAETGLSCNTTLTPPLVRPSRKEHNPTGVIPAFRRKGPNAGDHGCQIWQHSEVGTTNAATPS
jgi:hypothetical protein